MQPPVRKQTDDELWPQYTALTALVTDPEEDRTRQEDGAKSDINYIVKRFGPQSFAPRGVARWGAEIDYDGDLQQALDGVAAAKRAMTRMNPQLRDQFPTWESVVEGLADGSFKAALVELAKPEVVNEPVSEEVATG